MLQDSELKEIESAAVEMTGAAGGILLKYFGLRTTKPPTESGALADEVGERLQVSFKDKRKHNPVTDADKASQDYLKEAITSRFPSHGVVGEEDSVVKDVPAPDYLWVLDPLDGTSNFLNGLPIYAVSVGVMHRGEPVAGCLFIPWPREEGGIVMHARRGGGAFLGDDALSLAREPDGPQWTRLSAMPAYWAFRLGFRKEMRKKVGEVRTTGSMAHELALVSQGVLQYAVHTRPHLWDVAGGVPIIMEAGGRVMVRRKKSNEGTSPAEEGYVPRGWESLRTFFPEWRTGQTTFKEVVEWTVPAVVSGPEGVAEVVAANLQSRGRLARKVRNVLGL